MSSSALPLSLAVAVLAGSANPLVLALPRTVTFNRDIAPLVFRSCATCHRPGDAAPFSLVTYDEVRQHARQIATVTESRYMPPWKPEPGYGDFAGVRRLGDEEVDLFRQWIDGGLLRGDPDDLPPAPRWATGWQLGEPDMVLTMPTPYLLKGDGPDQLRTFVIPIPVPATRYVKGVEFHPGNSRAVHHANIKIDRTRLSRRFDDEDPDPGYDGGGSREARFPDGHFLGWTPGQLPHLTPDGSGWRLDPDSDLVVELHMMPTGKPESVRVTVGLFFTDRPPVRVPYMLRLGRQDIDIPPGEGQYVSSDSYALPVDVEIVAVQPHAHYLAREISGVARLPDGTTKALIYIKSWDFNWQDVYQYATPLSLPKGTTITMRYTYDNSSDNPRNRNHPSRRVTFGQTSASEMGDLWIQVQTRTSEDRQALDRDFAPKMLREDTAGDEKILEINPQDARTRADLGSCYLAAGRTADAIVQLEESLRIDPASAGVHYDLGFVLLGQRRFDAAGVHFTEAVRLKPEFSEAANNLGVVREAQGKLDDAIRWYEQAVTTSSDNARAHYNLGRALALLGKSPQAKEHYERALQIDPTDADSYTSLATLLASEQRIDEAIANYRRALDVHPDMTGALIDLAWILATSERPDVRAPEEAVRLAERAVERTGRDNATVLDTLAVAYAAVGQHERALAVEENALTVASRLGSPELIEQIRLRLERFRQSLR